MFEKSPDIKFHENPSRGYPSCSMRMNRETDKHDEKIMDAFRNFAKAPNDTVRTIVSMYNYI